MSDTKTIRQAAEAVLYERGPLHYRELTEEVLRRRLWTSSSKTPAASLRSAIAVDIKRNGDKSRIVRVRKGVFGLRESYAASAPSVTPSPDVDPSEGEDRIHMKHDSEQRVRTPRFPIYREVRHLLRVWPGRPRKQITGFLANLTKLMGTPQNTVDWTDPNSWISERLSGSNQNLAFAIWTESGKSVNPRHTSGHWQLSQKYKLVEEDPAGIVVLTDLGRDFLDNEGGKAELHIDEQEGLVRLLALVASNSPTRTGGIQDEWSEYLKHVSSYGKPSTFRETLQRRLNNLIDRCLVDRKGTTYSVTDAGKKFLQRVGTGKALGGDEQQELLTLTRKQNASARERLREKLHGMSPNAFEHLVKRLLEEMDYQDVRVTASSADGGVDVIANIELGITSVCEVIQAKRHKRTIQRKDIDALRGSLYRFNAVRGTIIATSNFSSGTKVAAFAKGVAPITLIDGDKLIDLLIKHGIGIRKRTLEMLTIDDELFSELEREV